MGHVQLCQTLLPDCHCDQLNSGEGSPPAQVVHLPKVAIIMKFKEKIKSN